MNGLVTMPTDSALMLFVFVMAALCGVVYGILWLMSRRADAETQKERDDCHKASPVTMSGELSDIEAEMRAEQILRAAMPSYEQIQRLDNETLRRLLESRGAVEDERVIDEL